MKIIVNLLISLLLCVPALASAVTPSVTPSSGYASDTLFTVTVTLASEPASSIQVYAQFDDRNGGWINEASPGGQSIMSCSGITCTGSWVISKEGNRQVRIGFLSNGVVSGQYTSGSSFTVFSQIAKPNISGGVYIQDATGGFKLSWNSATGDVDEYKLYRSTSSSSSGSTVYSGSNTTYTDNTLVSGTKYYYRVKACNDAGCDESTQNYGTYTQPIPDISGGVYIQDVTGGFKLSWNSATGDVDEYKLYRLTSSSSWGSPVYSGSNTTYTDNNLVSGTKYYYKVKACNDAGCDESTQNYGTYTQPTPDISGGVNIQDATGGFKLSWNSATGDVDEYKLYRSTSSSSSGSSVYSGSNTTYTDNNLSLGTEYYYRVKACNDAGCDESTQDSRIYTESSTVTPLVTPSSGYASDTLFTVTVTLASEPSSSTQVYAQFDDGSGGWLSEASPGGQSIMSCSGSTCTGSWTISGEGDRQVRVGFLADGVVSGQYTPGASFTVLSPIEKPDISGGVHLQDATGGFKLSWNIATGDVDEYKLYRSTSSSSLGSTVYSGSNTTYTDNNLTLGTEYYYRVKACNDAGCDESTQDSRIYTESSAVTPSVTPSSGYASDTLFTVTVTLASEPSSSTQVYAQFDDGSGGWLSEASPGGQSIMSCSGSTCTGSWTISGEGDRQVRVGFLADGVVSGQYTPGASFTVLSPIEKPDISGSVHLQDATGGFKLSWNIATGDVDEYKLYRSTSSSSLGSTVYSGSNTTYTDNNLTSGTEYYYRVKACNDAGCDESTQDSRIYTESSAVTPSVTPSSGYASDTLFTVTVILASEPSNSIQVYAQFDDGSGGWLSEASLGGQSIMSCSGSTCTGSWTISGEGDRQVRIGFLADGVVSGQYTPGASFTVIDSSIPTIIGVPDITEWREYDVTAEEGLSIAIEVGGQMPAGYKPFLNFDNLQGKFFTEQNDGGHIPMSLLSEGKYYWRGRLDKPGVRSVRIGIFDTKGDSDASNDQLIGKYSESATCKTAYCLSAVTISKGVGDPSIGGSSSYKGVDVASGNYHLTKSDLAISGVGPRFGFSRAYNSKADSLWSFGYEMSVNYAPKTHNRQLSIGPMEDGRHLNFFKDMDGLWYPLNPGNFNQLIEKEDGFSIFTQGNRIYHFNLPSGDLAGRLESITDRLGQALQFTYENNKLAAITDANDRSYTIDRDSSGRVQRVTDFTNRYVEYSYDSRGLLTAVRNPRGHSEQYSYKDFGPMEEKYLLHTITDPRGNRKLTIEYTADGKVTELVDGANNSTTFEYRTNDKGQPVTLVRRPVIDGLNHNIGFILDQSRTRVIERVDAQSEVASSGNYRTQQQYKKPQARTRLAEQGLVTQVIKPLGVDSSGTIIQYDEMGKGNPTRVIDPYQRETISTWGDASAQSNLTPVTSITQPGNAVSRFEVHTVTGEAERIVDPEGGVTQRSFSADSGLLLSTKNGRQQTTTMAYDAIGNMVSITDALGSITKYDHDGLGRVISETSPLGLVTSYTYDEHSNLLTQKREAGTISYITKNGYDQADNLIWTEDPKGYRTSYEYDALNRKVAEVQSADGIEYRRSYQYDPLGRLSSVTNALNQTRYSHYTVRDLLEKKINARSETTVSYTYDANGNVATITDGEGRTVSRQYDLINRLLKSTDDKGNYEEYIYNVAGKVKEYRDQRGEITQYEYDLNGNLKKVIDAAGGITAAGYDANGNLIEVIDPNQHKVTYGYDALDRMISLTNHNGKSWRFEYDANGNLTKETLPDGARTERDYDPFNRTVALREFDLDGNQIKQMSFSYDANNNIISKSDGNSTLGYGYDKLNRLITATDHYGNQIGYSYDKVGNLATLTYPGNKAVSYSYDDAGRLNSVTDWLGNTTSYTRNKSGQIIGAELGNGISVSRAYDEAGRLTLLEDKTSTGEVITSHDLTLDKQGNITRAQTTLPLEPQLPTSTTMHYDESNRLIQMGDDLYIPDANGRTIQHSSGGESIVYHFNNDDLVTQIKKSGTLISEYGYDLNSTRISAAHSGVETRYLVDANASLPRVLAESDSQGEFLRYYIYGEGLIGQITANGEAYYHHYDPTGNTLALTNSLQVITDRYAYTPYGASTVEGESENPFRYSGKHGVMDDGNGLNYMRARYYKPDIQRFLSLDALYGDVNRPQSLNRYAYVLGNPVMGVDPSGYISEMKRNFIIDKVGGKAIDLSVYTTKELCEKAKDQGVFSYREYAACVKSLNAVSEMKSIADPVEFIVSVSDAYSSGGNVSSGDIECLLTSEILGEDYNKCKDDFEKFNGMDVIKKNSSHSYDVICTNPSDGQKVACNMLYVGGKVIGYGSKGISWLGSAVGELFSVPQAY
jgi:RHS repeat-associated protein